MAKALEGAALIVGAAAVFAVAPYLGAGVLAFVTSTAGSALISGIGLMGVGMEVGALSDLLKNGPSVAVTTRQSAQPYRVVYGQSRIGPSLAFESTTGHQLNHLWVHASHPCQSVDGIFLDKRQVFYSGRQGGNWGDADGSTHTTADGNQYNLGGLVFIEHRYGHPGQLVRDASGNPAPTPHIQSLQGNDGKWDPAHILNGHCISYVKCTFDATQFASGQPSVKVAIQGKCDIYDPRSGTYGYTTNAALCIADYMTNQTFGLGMSWDEIDLDELIASANVCDEPVTLANGLTEYRYTCNGTFTTDASRSDILSSMLESCAGRLAFIGGKHKIIAGYDRGASLTFTQDDFTGPVVWSSKRSFRGLYNEVQPVFTCPNYPYQVVGNLYNVNNPQPNVFDGAWQPTSAPPYSLSDARGYTLYPLTDFKGNAILNADGSPRLGDAFMAEDNGQRLTTDLKLQFVISCAQAQRLARIKLMRFRQQGSGTLPLKLSGLRTCALDNVLVTYAPFGWVNKEMEVSGWRFVPKQSQDNEGVLLETEIDVAETDPASIYYWSTSEEIALNAADYLTIANSAQVESPTALTLTSGAATEIVAATGIVTPRILASWIAPADPLITSGGSIALQYQLAGGGWWLNGPALTGDTTSCYIGGVVVGSSYNVRIRSVSSTGALGSWIEDDGHVVSATNSVITTGSLNPNSPANTSNTASIDSIVESSNATMRIYGPGGDGSSWTRYVGATGVLEPAAHITGLAFDTTFYIVLDVQTNTYLALTNYLDSLADAYYYIGTRSSCSASYTGTGTGTGGSGGGSGGGAGGGGGRNPVQTPEQSEQ